MLHYLTEALTGLAAGDEFRKRDDWYELISIKTHYPARPHKIESFRHMNRAILLIRNPIHALPSHANYHYEKDSKLADHTTRAPTSYWVEWRDHHFEDEIELWGNHIGYWASEVAPEKRLVVSYEHLVGTKRGPIETARIASFLGRGKNVDAVPQERVPCVWDRVVNYKGKTKRRAVEYVRNETPDSPDNHSLRDGPDVEYDFTKTQLQRVLDVLEDLKSRFMSEYTLIMILEEYIEDIKQKLKKPRMNNDSLKRRGERTLEEKHVVNDGKLKEKLKEGKLELSPKKPNRERRVPEVTSTILKVNTTQEQRSSSGKEV